MWLEQQCTHAAHFALFLDKDFKVLINNGDSQKNSRSGADGAHKIGGNGKSANAKPTKGRRCRNVTVQLVDHGGFAMATHHHLLLTQLFCHLELRIKIS